MTPEKRETSKVDTTLVRFQFSACRWLEGEVKHRPAV